MRNTPGLAAIINIFSQLHHAALDAFFFSSLVSSSEAIDIS